MEEDNHLGEWNVINNNGIPRCNSTTKYNLREHACEYKMSGILYLNADDFLVKKGDKGNLMCLSYDVHGLSLVLFYSNDCQHCNKLMVRYKQLPYNINGCQFTMINVNKSENRRVVQMSNQTIVPITYVPDIILYVDGIPYMRYDGDHEIQSIKTFILDIYQQLQKTAFMESNGNRAPSSSSSTSEQRNSQVPNGSSSGDPSRGEGSVNAQGRPPRPHAPSTQPHDSSRDKKQSNGIPAYTIGKPKCSGERDDVCYVTFTEAYNAGGPKKGERGEPSAPTNQPVFYQQ